MTTEDTESTEKIDVLSFSVLLTFSFFLKCKDFVCCGGELLNTKDTKDTKYTKVLRLREALGFPLCPSCPLCFKSNAKLRIGGFLCAVGCGYAALGSLWFHLNSKYLWLARMFHKFAR